MSLYLLEEWLFVDVCSSVFEEWRQSA